MKISKSTILSSEVLTILKNNFKNYDGTPFCFVEVSHRSKNYANLNIETCQAIKSWLGTPQFECLLMPSGTAMASIYYNLIVPQSEKVHVVFYSQGQFSLKYYQQMKQYHERVHLVNTPESLKSKLEEIKKIPDSHILLHVNQIENGLQVELPEIGQQLLQNCRIIRNLNYCLTEECKVNNESIFYFQSETGFSVPGFTAVLISKQLIGSLIPNDNCPDMFGFPQMLKMKSIVNTPFTLCTYIFLFNLKFAVENKQKIQNNIREYKKSYNEIICQYLQQHKIQQLEKKEDKIELRKDALSFLRVFVGDCEANAVEPLKKCGFYEQDKQIISFYIQNDSPSTIQELQQQLNKITVGSN